jgi:hypothetical protein
MGAAGRSCLALVILSAMGGCAETERADSSPHLNNLGSGERPREAPHIRSVVEEMPLVAIEEMPLNETNSSFGSENVGVEDASSESGHSTATTP